MWVKIPRFLLVRELPASEIDTPISSYFTLSFFVCVLNWFKRQFLGPPAAARRSLINKSCLFAARIILYCRKLFSLPANCSTLDIAEAVNVDFIFHLSADVIIDSLRFGRRRQLAVLELIGRRFHVLIDVGLSGAPFLYFKYLLCAIERPITWFKKMNDPIKFDISNGKVSSLF